MKRIAMLLALITLFCVSCGAKEKTDFLGYQKSGLYIDALFTIDDESFPAIIELKAPEYDESERMLARSARLTLEGNSIISGVSFEFDSGTAYVVSGLLKIPVEDDELISGIADILSLFCISPDSFYESNNTELDGIACTHTVYTEGATEMSSGNRVDVYIDGKNGLPLKIDATIGDKKISADINEIKTE